MSTGSVGKFIYKGRVRKFNYHPRFYDESKEFLERRKSIVKRDLGDENGSYISKIHLGMFQEQRVKKRQSVSDILGSNLLFILILTLIPVAWVIYGEASLWLGGVCLTIPLLIKIMRHNGFFDRMS